MAVMLDGWSSNLLTAPTFFSQDSGSSTRSSDRVVASDAPVLKREDSVMAKRRAANPDMPGQRAAGGSLRGAARRGGRRARGRIGRQGQGLGAFNQARQAAEAAAVGVGGRGRATAGVNRPTM